MGHISLSPAAGAAAPCVPTSIIQIHQACLLSCTDSMCVIGARPPDQTTHWLPALIHFHFHLPLSPLTFLICALPLFRSLPLWWSPIPSHPPLSFISCSAQIFFGGVCRVLNGFWTLLFLLCFILFPHASPLSVSLAQISNHSKNRETTALQKKSLLSK